MGRQMKANVYSLYTFASETSWIQHHCVESTNLCIGYYWGIHRVLVDSTITLSVLLLVAPCNAQASAKVQLCYWQNICHFHTSDQWTPQGYISCGQEYIPVVGIYHNGYIPDHRDMIIVVAKGIYPWPQGCILPLGNIPVVAQGHNLVVAIGIYPWPQGCILPQGNIPVVAQRYILVIAIEIYPWPQGCVLSQEYNPCGKDMSWDISWYIPDLI